MFDIGLQEMLVIGVLALLVFGPSKLPELGRMFGRAMREFRRASDEFRTTVETNLHINEPEPIGSMPSVAEPPASVVTDGPLTTPPGALPSELEPGVGFETVLTADLTRGEPFCAQRGSRLFHRSECGWVKRIPEVERVYLKKVAEAREQGLTPCPVCEPWEPA
jgi:TatA/E family protein of Tat protein translocase